MGAAPSDEGGPSGPAVEGSAYIPNLGQVDAKHIEAVWSRPNNPPPEYERAFASSCLLREWLTHTRILRYYRSIGSEFAADPWLPQLVSDGAHFDALLLQLIQKGYGLRSPEQASKQRDVLCGHNIFNSVKQLYQSAGHKRAHLAFTLQILLEMERADAISAKLSEVCDRAPRCASARQQALNLLVSHCYHLKHRPAQTDRPSGNLDSREGALSRFYECMEDYIDDHKERAFKSSFMEPARYYFFAVGDQSGLDHVNVHGLNWYLALLHAALGIQTPLLPAYDDNCALGLADFWAGLQDCCWGYFADPANFGAGFEGIPQLRGRKLAKRKVAHWHFPEGVHTPLAKQLGNRAVNPAPGCAKLRRDCSVYLERFMHFFSRDFFLRKAFETLNAEVKPEHVGWRKACETLYQLYREGHRADEASLAEHCYRDDYFTDLNIDRVHRFFAWLGVAAHPDAALDRIGGFPFTDEAIARAASGQASGSSWGAGQPGDGAGAAASSTGFATPTPSAPPPEGQDPQLEAAISASLADAGTDPGAAELRAAIAASLAEPQEDPAAESLKAAIAASLADSRADPGGSDGLEAAITASLASESLKATIAASMWSGGSDGLEAAITASLAESQADPNARGLEAAIAASLAEAEADPIAADVQAAIAASLAEQGPRSGAMEDAGGPASAAEPPAEATSDSDPSPVSEGPTHGGGAPTPEAGIAAPADPDAAPEQADAPALASHAPAPEQASRDPVVIGGDATHPSAAEVARVGAVAASEQAPRDSAAARGGATTASAAAAAPAGPGVAPGQLSRASAVAGGCGTAPPSATASAEVDAAAVPEQASPNPAVDGDNATPPSGTVAAQAGTIPAPDHASLDPVASGCDATPRVAKAARLDATVVPEQPSHDPVVANHGEALAVVRGAAPVAPAAAPEQAAASARPPAPGPALGPAEPPRGPSGGAGASGAARQPDKANPWLAEARAQVLDALVGAASNPSPDLRAAAFESWQLAEMTLGEDPAGVRRLAKLVVEDAKFERLLQQAVGHRAEWLRDAAGVVFRLHCMHREGELETSHANGARLARAVEMVMEPFERTEPVQLPGHFYGALYTQALVAWLSALQAESMATAALLQLAQRVGRAVVHCFQHTGRQPALRHQIKERIHPEYPALSPQLWGSCDSDVVWCTFFK